MKFLRRLFGLDPPVDPSEQARKMSKDWFDSYRKWCDEQVCSGGCGAVGSNKAKPWITETLCYECWQKGARPVEGAGEQWRNGPNFNSLIE